MRRRKPAPHGFAVNGNLNKNKRVEFDVPYLLLAPRQPWEPCGQACSLQAVHWLPEGLADYNPRSASPSDVWANDSAYHNPPPKVMAKRATTPSFRSKCIARNQEQQPPSHKREAACALVRHGAFSEVRSKFARRTFSRSLRRERTRMAGIHFSSYKANVSFSPFAP